jgi:hypothetical protein
LHHLYPYRNHARRLEVLLFALYVPTVLPNLPNGVIRAISVCTNAVQPHLASPKAGFHDPFTAASWRKDCLLDERDHP